MFIDKYYTYITACNVYNLYLLNVHCNMYMYVVEDRLEPKAWGGGIWHAKCATILPRPLSKPPCGMFIEQHAKIVY